MDGLRDPVQDLWKPVDRVNRARGRAPRPRPLDRELNKAARLEKRVERRIFPEGKDKVGRPYDDPCWSRFKDRAPEEMYDIVGKRVFPSAAMRR